MIKRYQVLLTALESIAHGATDGSDSGTNARLFMRSTLLVDGIPARVPDISENALRSIIFRRTLADHMLSTLEIGKGELPQAVMNLLYSGGNLGAGGRAPGDEIELGHRIRELYPMLELLGGATDTFILPKSRLSLATWPVTREYAPYLAHLAPDLDCEVSAFDLLDEETRTRGTSEESSGNQMLYSYETMAAGTQILMEATLDPWATTAAVAALSLALDNWSGYFGGQGRQGRGRMVAEWRGEQPASDDYAKHCQDNADAMKQGLINGTLGTDKTVCGAI